MSRDLCIAMLPHLVTIDSKEITPTERIRAVQQISELRKELEVFIQEQRIKASLKTDEEKAKEYNPESRRQMYMEMKAEQDKKEESRKDAQKDKDKPKAPSSMYNKDGEMRQCNEGRYEYKLREWDDPEWSFFEMQLPHFLDTSQISFELFPNFVSIR